MVMHRDVSVSVLIQGCKCRDVRIRTALTQYLNDGLSLHTGTPLARKRASANFGT